MRLGHRRAPEPIGIDCASTKALHIQLPYKGALSVPLLTRQPEKTEKRKEKKREEKKQWKRQAPKQIAKADRKGDRAIILCVTPPGCAGLKAT